jgi:hypothetical protein
MKEYPCKACGEMLNIGMCQSGIVVEGETFPAHVHCADQWANEEIDVFKVTSPGNGSYYEEFAENVTEMLKESDDGGEYVIKKERMSRAKYESLDEFQGF